MRSTLSAVFIFWILQCVAFAAAPAYSLDFKDGDFFQIQGNPSLRIYSLSDTAKAVTQTNRQKLDVAACHSGIHIKTNDPANALREILDQIAVASGEPISSFYDSHAAAQLSPSRLTVGISEKTIWHLLLTPTTESNVYLLTLTCLRDA